MGYGHLRPARALAARLGTTVMHADREPLADREERRAWARSRSFYESSQPRLGSALGRLADPTPCSTRSPTSRRCIRFAISRRRRSACGARTLRAARVSAASLVAYLADRDMQLLTTFYSPAVLADFHGYDRIFCIVTDSDVNRVWAPINPGRARSATSRRAAASCAAACYGVNKAQIEFTGFPLPHSLVGGPTRRAERNLARASPGSITKAFSAAIRTRLRALGPLPSRCRPPHLVFAVGGAGAQAELPALSCRACDRRCSSGRLRLTLVAGVARDALQAARGAMSTARGFRASSGSNLDILFEPETRRLLRSLRRAARARRCLWTKPSEMVLYAGLGLPLLLTKPIGIHENYNRRCARENGAALKQRDPRTIGERLRELLDDGNLAAAAWAGYRRLPHLGLYRILDRLDNGRVTRPSRPAGKAVGGPPSRGSLRASRSAPRVWLLFRLFDDLCRLRTDDELHAAVLRAVLRRVVGGDRVVGAVALGLSRSAATPPLISHARTDSARCCESCHVQLVAAGAVGVALDLDQLDLRVAQEHVRDLAQQPVARRHDLGALGRELHLLGDHDLLLAQLDQRALRLLDQDDLRHRRVLRLDLDLDHLHQVVVGFDADAVRARRQIDRGEQPAIVARDRLVARTEQLDDLRSESACRPRSTSWPLTAPTRALAVSWQSSATSPPRSGISARHLLDA